MQVGEILKAIRGELGLSQGELARRAGLSPQYISDVEKGRARPSLRALEKIAAALGVPVARLLGSVAADTVVQVPVLGRVPAGGPVLVEENILEYLPLPERFVRGDTFCLQVQGDSMVDVGIDNGDYLIVYARSTADNGQTVIARVDGQVTCKRFYRCNGKVRLEPANRSYRPIEANNIEILGVVAYVIKKI